ncbi:unnamed protein product [Alopecurus aequalis]
MDNNRDINIKEGEVFPNEGAENNTGNGKAVQLLHQIRDEVQRILERNRMLIQEIGQSHESREAGGLNRTVALFREFHSNMARIINLYNELSSSVSRSLAKGSPVAVDGTKGDNIEATTSKVEETYKFPLYFDV